MESATPKDKERALGYSFESIPPRIEEEFAPES